MPDQHDPYADYTDRDFDEIEPRTLLDTPAPGMDDDTADAVRAEMDRREAAGLPPVPGDDDGPRLTGMDVLAASMSDDERCADLTPHGPHWQHDAEGEVQQCPGVPGATNAAAFGIVEDGFGSCCLRCGPKCDLVVVRPGRFMCQGGDNACPDLDTGVGEAPAAEPEAPSLNVSPESTQTAHLAPPSLFQVRASAPDAAVVEMRWLDDGRLDVEYDPERTTEAARVFFDAVRRTFVRPDMVLTPPAGADDVLVQAEIAPDMYRIIRGSNPAIGVRLRLFDADDHGQVVDLLVTEEFAAAFDRAVPDEDDDRDDDSLPASERVAPPARQADEIRVGVIQGGIEDVLANWFGSRSERCAAEIVERYFGPLATELAELRTSLDELTDVQIATAKEEHEQRQRAERLENIGLYKAAEAEIAERDATIADLQRQAARLATAKDTFADELAKAQEASVADAETIGRLREADARVRRLPEHWRNTVPGDLHDAAADLDAALDGTDGAQ